jgi:hypothetical protein
MKIDLTDPAVYTAGRPYDQFRWLQGNDRSSTSAARPPPTP